MKIIYISQGNIPSKWAHTFQAMRMAEAFAKKTDKFCLLTSGSIAQNGSQLDINEWYGIYRPFTIKRLPVYRKFSEPLMAGYRYPRFDKAAAIYSRLKSPDLVFTRSIYAGYLCVKLGLKTIVETHSVPEYSEFKRLLTYHQTKKLIGIVTITDDLKQLYCKTGIDGKKIFVWPDGVNLEGYASLPTKGELRAKLNLPRDRFIAVYSGHLYPEKGIDTILQAAKQCADVYFLIVGGWEKDIEFYKDQAKKINVDNINFAGFVPNKLVPEYLTAGDVLLMPNSAKSSHSWMSPLKLFEYLAAKKPIISSDLPPLRTYLTNGRNCLLIRPDDHHSLAEAINLVAAHKIERETIVNNASQDAKKYTWDSRVGKILNYYFN